VTETSHTRSRRASLYGLVLQLAVFAGTLGLAEVARSTALFSLAWYIAGGVLIWFACLLVFRQRELAALEALDLEELRREKQSTGGGEGMFDEEGGMSLGFRVAEARLRWMLRWLIPVFGLLNALYLAGMGAYLWWVFKPVGSPNEWQMMSLGHLPLAMIILAVMMVMLFLFSRYTSGMARVGEWQLLRGCSSYMLGNALGALALIICLGIYLYAETLTAEHVLAHVFPAFMVLLAAESIINFVLDIYRPRTSEVEARACFDSRLLGLISEPGGIATTIAEAINYQFGFQVSQTWFYQLMQRWFVPLLGSGLAILWLLTCIVVVQPGESVIIERFGRQANAEHPYEPGLYFKWPWPIEISRSYNTGTLHELIVGFKTFDAEPVVDSKKEGAVDLWTDKQHMGQDHFDFLVPVPPRSTDDFRDSPTSRRASDEGVRTKTDQAWPVNLVRLDVAVQYRIRYDKLAAYTRRTSNPEDTLRDIAWEEVVRYTACHDIFTLLGKKYGTAGAEFLERINRRLAALDVGLEVVYVGVQNVHPEPGVSKEFGAVVTAEQEKIAAIRGALVKQNQVLSAVAGDFAQAQALAQAVTNINDSAQLRDRSLDVLRTANAARVQAMTQRVDTLKPQFTAVVLAHWKLDTTRQDLNQIKLDQELGMGASDADVRQDADRTDQAEKELQAAEQTLEAAFAPIRTEALAGLDEPTVTALRNHAQARFALEFWNERLERLLPDIQGQAAAILAEKQADRWTIEMGNVTEVIRVEGERAAYRAAPRVYKLREYLDALVKGIQDSRKFFLAFDPAGRTVRVRFMAEEQSRPDISDVATRRQP
jgi:modulator of FtsH protease HflK